MQYSIDNGNIAVTVTAVNFDVTVGDAARLDIGTAVNYIKSGQAEIAQEVDNVLGIFNANAVQKTTEFNNNATSKTSDFNSNATSKTTDFNDNYTAKKALIDAEVQTAKDWATKTDGKVDGVDYSAKYYAQSILPIASDITTVAGISSDVTTVAGISMDVSTVADISADVTSVSGNATNINAVAGDLTNIDAVAADLTNIDNASLYASEAKQWAIGDPSEPSGNSAKYWANQAATTLANKQDKLTVGTGISISSGNVISVTAPTLINSAYDASYNLSVFGNSVKGMYNTVIGNDASLTVSNSSQANTVIGGRASATSSSYVLYATAVGFEAAAYNNGSISIGSDAITYGLSAIQIGTGANNTDYSLQVGFRDMNDISNSLNYQLLDGTTGLIPDARISSNIARSADVPAAQVNSDWNAVSGVAQILNKPTLGTMAAESASDYTPTASLATVATTGAYSDLSGTPTIPTVNNATLTITQGGISKGTFTANASSDVTIALDAGGGGGAVDSVNGYTGVVVLTASDVGVEAYTANEVETLWGSL